VLVCVCAAQAASHTSGRILLVRISTSRHLRVTVATCEPQTGDVSCGATLPTTSTDMQRRTFLTRSGAALAGSRIALSLPAAMATWATACVTREEGGGFTVLTASEATDLEAIAARILPSDDGPGAVEAGVIHFIDAALAGFRADSLEEVRRGLEERRVSVRREHGESGFASLDTDRQIAMLHQIEEGDFFDTVRFLTLAGMFSHPSYGGNRDEVGWKLIGFDVQGPTQPPFGYYDADYAEKGA